MKTKISSQQFFDACLKFKQKKGVSVDFGFHGEMFGTSFSIDEYFESEEKEKHLIENCIDDFLKYLNKEINKECL